MSLFIQKTFKMHSGEMAHFKLECDALTDEDWNTLALIVSKKFKFHSVIGVPTGGLKFAAALEKYATGDANTDPTLIVDDVLTTGTSMEEMRYKVSRHDEIGVVVFARKPLDANAKAWIYPMFQLWE